MVKPIVNLAEVEFDDVEENGLYTSSRGPISDSIGARIPATFHRDRRPVRLSALSTAITAKRRCSSFCKETANCGLATSATRSASTT